MDWRKPRTRAAWAAELLKAATILKPEGPGPFPTVIQLHGCGGLRPLQTDYAKAAQAAGVAVVIVDSFAPRGISRVEGAALVCTGAKLRGAERSADVFALYDWLRGESWVDKDRIAAAGWSHGGWTIMDALALGERAGQLCHLTDIPPGPLKDLAAAIVIYPYAGYPAKTVGHGWGEHRPKVFALLCGKDQVVGARHPPRALQRLERDGLTVEAMLFDDATHAFDDVGANDPRSRYRADLFDTAKDWYAASLRKAFA